ncbi:MAG: hypothetical protein R6U96_17170 [Promethearchaeia archaeon]
MPAGTFVILLPKDRDYEVLGTYYKEKLEEQDFQISSNLFLRLNLNHDKNEFSLIKLKDLNLVSYLHHFEGKLTRKYNGFILGLLIEEENPEKYRTGLKNTAKALASKDILDYSEQEFNVLLKKTYQQNLEKSSDRLEADQIKESVINKTKDMLGGGKKERKIAQELLEKIEDDLHLRVSKYYNSAEQSVKKKDYGKAAKLYKKAAEGAEELREEDLKKTFFEKAENAKRVPEMIEERDDAIEEARDNLRDEDFNAASQWYKKASKISKELMQTEKEEEYRLKAKALQDFYRVDQRFKNE